MARHTLPSPCYIRNADVAPGIRSGINYARGLDIRLAFINHSAHAVYVTTRDGVTTHFPPHDQYPIDEFIINKTYRVSGVGFNVGNPCDKDPKYMGFFERNVYAHQQAYDRENGNHEHYANSFYTKYVVEPSLLSTYETKSVYLMNLDVVVSLLPPTEGVAHPFTLHGESDYFIDQINQMVKTEDACVLGIRLVDNDRKVGDQFINVSGQVIKITALRDLSRPDGVYIFTTDSFSKKPPQYYTLEDMNKSGILFYASQELAQTAGNPKTIYDERLRHADHAHKMLELEIKKELEQERKLLEQEKNKTKHLEEANKKLAASMEYKRTMEKNEYERRAQKRKDSSDDLKWMAALTVAVFAALAALAKAYSAGK